MWMFRAKLHKYVRQIQFRYFSNLKYEIKIYHLVKAAFLKIIDLMKM